MCGMLCESEPDDQAGMLKIPVFSTLTTPFCILTSHAGAFLTG